MNQIAFLTGIYLIGFVFGLNFKRNIPFPFICLTAFFWGATIWVVLNIGCLLISSPSEVSTAVLMAISFSVFSISAILRNHWKLKTIEIAWLVGTLALLILITSFFTLFNFSNVTGDGLYMIQMGREVILHGADSWGMASPASYGVFIPFMQSASVYLDLDYLYALQPTLGIMFIFSFLYLNFHLFSYFISSKRHAIGISLLATIALVSTYFIFFQLFYIHTNFPSAIFLYFTVCALWLSHKELNNIWMVFAILALTGFSLSRTENILFALIVLAIFVSSGQRSRPIQPLIYLPFLIFFILWNLRITNMPSSYLDVLNKKINYAIVFMLIAFGVLILLSNQDWIKKNVIMKLDQIIWIVFGMSLILMFLIKPEQMITGLINLFTNLFSTGGWGFTWFFLIGLIIITWFQSSIHGDSIFISVILLYFIFVMLMMFFRSPYRIGWGDSANRMMTTIVPITFTYFILKYGQSISSWSESSKNSTMIT